jgi:thiol-disulfide isomerase/thioredoxin
MSRGMRWGSGVALLTGALVLLSACANSHEANYPDGTSLKVQTPDLVALKKQTDVPNCPKVGPQGSGMPAVTLSCLGGGRSVDVAGLRGPLILNFWASWCGGCKQEMPALAAYAKSQSRVKVLGVDFLDPAPDKALELAASSKVAYPLVADPKGALDRRAPMPHPPGLPFTVFLDARGHIAHAEATVFGSEQEVAAAARKYLGTGG